jgi:N-acetylmuramoyl-L-alanine amidase
MIVDLGAPEYTMYDGGPAKTRKAPATIGVIMKNTPTYAEVNKAVINTYSTPTTANGAAYELYSGMVDYVTAITGNYLRLSSGLYVNKNDVKAFTTDMQLRSVVTNATYTTGEKWDSLKLDMSGNPAAISAFDGTTLKLDISKAYSSVLPVLPENSLFSTITVTENDDKVQYVLTLKSDQRIEGYIIEKTTSGLSLNIKRPVKLTVGDKPLLGITIMLDPGHGGSDPGAMGPLGIKYPEKTINFNTAMKLKTELESIGATVLMTRTTDKDVTLDERHTASRNAKPDMFISIHANSMGDNVDISKVDGFSVFYKEKLAQSLADSVFNNTIQGLGRNNKGLHVRNLYVTRGTWTPSMLLESGFIPNPNEFEWLIDENEQLKLAQNIKDAVIKYLTPKEIVQPITK